MPTLQQKIDSNQYASSYRESMFQIWYNAECPAITELAKIVPADDRGITPDVPCLSRWKKEDQWDIRADALNGQAALRIDNTLIEQRVEMFKKHAELGKSLATKGEEYLEQHGLDTGAEAIRAIVEGTDLERKSLGYAEFMNKILTADDDTLNKELNKLIGKGDIIDGEVKDADVGSDQLKPNS